MKKILIGVVAASAIGATALATPSTADARSGGGWGHGGGWGYSGSGYRGWGYSRWGYPGWGYRGWDYGGWGYRGWGYGNWGYRRWEGYGGWGIWPYVAFGGWPLDSGLGAAPLYALSYGLPAPVFVLRAAPRALSCHRSQETRTVPSEEGGTRQITIRRCQS